jgi:hypothetical protein
MANVLPDFSPLASVFMQLHKNCLSASSLSPAFRLSVKRCGVTRRRNKSTGVRSGALELALDPLGVAAAVEHGFYVGGAGVDLVINGEREDVTQ